MMTTCNHPVTIWMVDPSPATASLMARVASSVARADGGVYPWTMRNRDGSTLHFSTNAEGDVLSFESHNGRGELISPPEFTVRDCRRPHAVASSRRRNLTHEGFEVTTGHATPNATHPAGATSVMEF